MANFGIGPGILITAAFIGPGTLTACSLVGVGFGLSLLWALLLSLVLTGFLQTLVARLSWETGLGLVELVYSHTNKVALRNALLGWILFAIFIGNTAYESGNVSGALLGLTPFFPVEFLTTKLYKTFSIGGIGLGLGVVLWFGNPRWIKNLLFAVVLLMSLSFVITAFWVRPSMEALLFGLFYPKIPEDSFWTILALVGTTIVPYNLFLHAALVKKKLTFSSLAALKKDTLMAIALGGCISLSIVIAASAVGNIELRTAADLGLALVPLYGEAAQYLIGFGLFAAGFSSALTAPLAVSLVVEETLDWPSTSRKTKCVALGVLGFGLASLFLELPPTQLIQWAQIANALLLPFMVLFLMYLVRTTKSTISTRIILNIIFIFFIGLAINTISQL